MAHILDHIQARFLNPCPVCGAEDDHAAWRERVLTPTFVGDACPHPAERGHGTGCCCAGWSEEGRRRHMRELAKPRPLTPDQVRDLLRECVTVVKPGEVLVLRCPEDWVIQQVGAMAGYAAEWVNANAPDIRVLVVPHLDMAVMEAQGGAGEPSVA